MILGQNVLAHGADPTGNADSTQAFNNAMDALPETGGIVYIPAGRYWIQNGPIKPAKSVSFIGAGGVARTGGGWGGSATTLFFPLNCDGFEITESGARGIRIENLAVVRGRPKSLCAPGDFEGFPEGTPQYGHRGIYAELGFFAKNLYLVRWERGIHLAGRESLASNTNGFRIENIFAEDCYWATFVHGNNAQAGSFRNIFAFQCQGGIYDSSSAGNGYSDCYVENPYNAVDVPYYLDSASQLRNCGAEAPFASQIAVAQVIGGFSNNLIEGIPARIDSLNFSVASMETGDQVRISLDSGTPLATEITISFEAGEYTPEGIVRQINSIFPHRPAIARADVFDGSFVVRGRVPHFTGNISISEVGSGNVLPRIGFPVNPDGTPAHSRSNTGANRGQIITSTLTSHLKLSNITGPLGSFGVSEHIEVNIAGRGNVPIMWEARGETAEGVEYGLARIRQDSLEDPDDPESPLVPHKRRWAFVQSVNAGDDYGFLGFTGAQDEMGAGQTLVYRGLWITGNPAVLLTNRRPDNTQGRVGDCAWNMSENPPRFYRKYEVDDESIPMWREPEDI